MTWAEALEIVVARTGVGRYRYLCSDEHADHARWRAKVVELATGDPPPRSDAGRNARLALLAQGCPYRSKFPPCGCSGYRCGIGQRIVSGPECWDCVERYGI